MSKYTIELRELFTTIKYNPPLYTRSQVEGFFKDYELTDYLTSDQIDVITESGVWSKDRLARKIVDHYYMRELGQETIGLWKHYVKVTMQELMEEYLPLIYSSAIEYDPLINVNYTESFSRTASNSGSADSSGLGVASDTPQGQISKANILAGNYASSTSASENETESSSESEEEYTKTIVGNSGVSATAQKMIEQYRNNIRAIDREIIEKLEPLFMGLY